MMISRTYWQRVHKWIFTFMGVFMLVWLISGILMLVPGRWFGELPPKNVKHVVDYSQIALSPADIVSLHHADNSALRSIDTVVLNKIRERVIYKVRFSGGETRRFDAQTGEPFVFTPELAEALARDAYPSTAAVRSIEMIEKYDLLYSWGPLPVYRIRFEDHLSAIVTVVQENARVMRLTSMMGIRRAITGLHGFEPVKLFTDNNTVRKGLLIVTGAITLFGTFVGIFLIWPIRREDYRAR